MIYLKNISSFNSVLNSECIDCQFTRVSIDTRDYKETDLFVAITGEKFNAFSLVGDIIQKGCECIVFTLSPENEELLERYKTLYPRVKFIATTDSIHFLQDLAKDHVHRLKAINPNLTLVSISGSNGKTTCKEILRHFLLELKVSHVATQKNDNNHLGVPLTLLRLSETDQVGIIELGSNHPGEIKSLCSLFIPDHVYVTNIGMTHMEFFPTLDDVFLEEAYPLQNLRANQIGWLNKDDEYLKSLLEVEDPQKSFQSMRVIGQDANSFELTHKTIHLWGESIENLNLLGEYNYHNLGAMLIIAESILGSSRRSDLIKAARSYVPNLMRSQWVEVGNTRVFLDAYNANPSSMKLSLEGFIKFVAEKENSLDGVRIIIGDMLELGEAAQNLHYDIGRYLQTIDGPEFIFIGNLAMHYQSGFKNNSQLFKNVGEFINSGENPFKNCKYLFLKASRSLQLERILDNI